MFAMVVNGEGEAFVGRQMSGEGECPVADGHTAVVCQPTTTTLTTDFETDSVNNE